MWSGSSGWSGTDRPLSWQGWSGSQPYREMPELGPRRGLRGGASTVHRRSQRSTNVVLRLCCCRAEASGRVGEQLDLTELCPAEVVTGSSFSDRSPLYTRRIRWLREHGCCIQGRRWRKRGRRQGSSQGRSQRLWRRPSGGGRCSHWLRYLSEQHRCFLCWTHLLGTLWGSPTTRTLPASGTWPPLQCRHSQIQLISTDFFTQVVTDRGNDCGI